MIPAADVVVAKVVPRRPRRAAAGRCRPSRPRGCRRSARPAGRPARPSRSGEWLLRAHAGITGRANSAMAVGDPGRPLRRGAGRRRRRGTSTAACRRCCSCRWPTRSTRRMADLGWRRQHVTIVQVAPVVGAARLAAEARRPDRHGDARADAGMALADARPRRRRPRHPCRDPHRPAGRRLRDADPRRRAGRHRPGLGRGRLGRHHLGRRRAGLRGGRASPARSCAPSCRWAGERGAHATYLQVRAANDAALRLYAALGYVTHHPYVYRAPAPR